MAGTGAKRQPLPAGKVADITIFDPDTIASKPREPVATLPAGGVQVRRDAVGIDYVVVNGSVLLDKGELTDALPGQIIRGPLYQASRRSGDSFLSSDRI